MTNIEFKNCMNNTELLIKWMQVMKDILADKTTVISPDNLLVVVQLGYDTLKTLGADMDTLQKYIDIVNKG